MMRSLIGIVCAFILLANSTQTTAAQFLPDSHHGSLYSAASSLSDLIRIADEGSAERILSSDAYHSDLRFRAAPVKQMRNWQMPIVDVRPAKLIDSEQELKPAEDRDAISVASQPKRTKKMLFDAIAAGTALGRTAATKISQRLVSYQNQFAASVKNQVSTALAYIPQPKKAEATKDASAQAAGRADYWNYYSDCDRWDVVFSIAWQEKPQADGQVISDNQDKASVLRAHSQQIFVELIRQFTSKVAHLGDLSDRYFQIIR